MEQEADSFILGDSSNVFYNFSESDATGFAAIADFDLSNDTIQLNGSQEQYSLSQGITDSGDVFTNIFLNTSEQTSELISTLQEVQVSDFSSGFVFV